MYNHKIMCAWLSRSARELSHVHSRQKGPRTGNRRTRKTILVAMESTEKAIAVLAWRRSEILEGCGKLFSFH